jgi:hypothetical protein
MKVCNGNHESRRHAVQINFTTMDALELLLAVTFHT